VEKPLALIIEDEDDLSFIFAEAIGEAGFETEIIKTGDEALARLAELVPDLVILDLHLPRVVGTDILARIRQDGRLDGTRVIVATADATRAEILHERADLVLLKPIGYRQLRDLATRLRASPLSGVLPSAPPPREGE
jgi:two-component system response regulator AdeR